MTRTVVVGASIAGLSAAETLRRSGQDGPITIVGAEEYRPYRRPELSKRVLTGALAPADAALPVDEHLGASWRPGRCARSLDLDRRTLRLDSGEQLGWDHLVIATGATPILPGPFAGWPGVHVLRTLDDALALKAALDRAPRVVVVGAGWLGLEVAASCRSLGLEVTVADVLELPVARFIGRAAALRCLACHRDHGVELRTGVGVRAVLGSGRVEAVRLDDGAVVPADVVVVGVGARPETSWLTESGLDLDHGVSCDSALRVLRNGQPVPGVVAAGDVARWRSNGIQVRNEHWTNAMDQGVAAARTLLAPDGQARPFGGTSYFWSDQYDQKLQFVGEYHPDDDSQLVAGAPSHRQMVVAFGRQSHLVGAVGFNHPGIVMRLRQAITEKASFPPTGSGLLTPAPA